MKPQENEPQISLFGIQLEQICDSKHALFCMGEAIDWQAFEEEFAPLYCEDNGRPGKPIRLMVGLHYLKALYGESDEGLVEKWVENPYWQYFCGETEFQHAFPIEPTSMNKWRKRVKSEGLEKLLEVSIKTGIETGTIKREHLKKVNVDTTVQEKAITFPTDAKLYHRCREKLVCEAKELSVELRQHVVGRWMKRRAAIEPIIGHMKNDCGDSRNHLLGEDGDRMNALMMGFGFNLRKVLRRFYFYLMIQLNIFVKNPSL